MTLDRPAPCTLEHLSLEEHAPPMSLASASWEYVVTERVITEDMS